MSSEKNIDKFINDLLLIVKENNKNLKIVKGICFGVVFISVGLLYLVDKHTKSNPIFYTTLCFLLFLILCIVMKYGFLPSKLKSEDDSLGEIEEVLKSYNLENLEGLIKIVDSKSYISILVNNQLFIFLSVFFGIFGREILSFILEKMHLAPQDSSYLKILIGGILCFFSLVVASIKNKKNNPFSKYLRLNYYLEKISCKRLDSKIESREKTANEDTKGKN